MEVHKREYNRAPENGDTTVVKSKTQ